MVILIPLMVSKSEATPIPFEFTGILPTVSQGPDPAFSSVSSSVETVTATYTFDSELVNLVPETNEGFYRPLSAFHIQIAELSWDFGGDINRYVYARNRYESVGGSGMDWYWVGSSDSIFGTTIAGMYMQGMSVQMTTNAFDFISRDALPLTPPDLTPFLAPVGPSAYAVAKIGLTFTDGTENHYLDSSIASAQVGPVAPVPKLSTMLLQGSELAGLVGYGRRRRFLK